MKITVIMGFIIFFLYALFGYQMDRISILTIQTGILKSTITGQYLTINKLEDYRENLKPPRFLPFGFPMIEEEYDSMTSYWALQNDPLRRRNTGGSNTRFHPAVDMIGVPGAQVLTVADGIVLEKWYEKGIHYVNGKWREYGGHKYFNGYVTIQHESLISEIFYTGQVQYKYPSGVYDGIIAHYGHIAEILVYEGDKVKAGQQIAQISQQKWKFSTGPHLDFRLQDNKGKFVNPLLWIGFE